jgi:hypothetical protein
MPNSGKGKRKKEVEEKKTLIAASPSANVEPSLWRGVVTWISDTVQSSYIYGLLALMILVVGACY